MPSLLVSHAADGADAASPLGASCASKTPTFGPTTSLTAGAITPPADGFFDATATYVGAFKDATDTWATTGKWAVWDAE